MFDKTYGYWRDEKHNNWDFLKYQFAGNEDAFMKYTNQLIAELNSFKINRGRMTEIENLNVTEIRVNAPFGSIGSNRYG